MNDQDIIDLYVVPNNRGEEFYGSIEFFESPPKKQVEYIRDDMLYAVNCIDMVRGKPWIASSQTRLS